MLKKVKLEVAITLSGEKGLAEGLYASKYDL